MAKIFMKESFEKQADVIEDIKKIVNNHSRGEVKFKDGTSAKVDAFTAQMLLKIYDSLSGPAKVKCHEMINENKFNFQKLINFGWKQVSNKKISADLDSVTEKVKDKMNFWKKHNLGTYMTLKNWFEVAVGRASFAGLPDINVHLGLTDSEYAILKKFVVTIRRAI